MRRKQLPPVVPASEPLIPEEILTPSNVYFARDEEKPVVACVVCGAATTEAGPDERLCWVCRRLKISAWRDSEPMPVQE